jgi:hypothetical protein
MPLFLDGERSDYHDSRQARLAGSMMASSTEIVPFPILNEPGNSPKGFLAFWSPQLCGEARGTVLSLTLMLQACTQM